MNAGAPASDPAAYLARVRAALTARADPVVARGMSAYLRSQFACLGVKTPVRRAACADVGDPGFAQPALLATADLLWSQPEREFRYVAIDLLARGHRRLGADAVGALLALAQRDAWWDTVDALAGVVGDVLRRERRSQPDIQRLMDDALTHPSLWVRRVAMLHQLGWRLDTDEARLFRYALALAGEPDFFIRKAIGWALRDYARWAPSAVRAFAGDHRAQLSPLSYAEATRRLPTPL